MANEHDRRLIREALGDLLMGKTSVGDSVFINRPTPAWDDSLPAHFIYTKGESVSVYSKSPKVYKRVLSLMLETLVATKADADDETGSFEIDDDLDILAKEIEDIILPLNVLYHPRTGLKIADDVTLTDVKLDLQDTGKRIVASQQMTIEIEYYTEQGETGDLATLKKLHVDYETAEDNNATPEATDDIVVQ